MAGVIVWLNGTFGAGKTSTAAELLPRMRGARLFDPETVGYMLAPNLADRPVTDFQHWEPWRALVVATAVELARYTGQHLIAPQTVLDRPYLQQIRSGLEAAGQTVFLVLLDASDDALRRRIEGSDEARQWRIDHLAAYRAAREWMITDADLVVDTTTLPPSAAAEKIAAALPG
jgi:chloramphenicol 3-O-phosphotransferase